MEKGSRHISYSILDLAPVSGNSTAAQTLEKSLDLARKAEELGYTRIWYAEHHNMISIASSATSVLVGYIAAGTRKIRVGSGGVMLPNHSPLIVAEQFGTLALLYPGRIDLGLGRAPGTDPETAAAIRPDRLLSVTQFPDEVSKIQQYLSRENSQARVRVPFAEGVELPVYILGSSTDSAWVAAKKGLPYAFASHFATAQLMEALQIYRNEFQPSAFLREPYTIAGINVIAADTRAEAEGLATTVLRMFLNILSGKPDYLQPPTVMTDELRELWQHPTVQQMLKYTFVGDQPDITNKTTEFIEQTNINELMVITNTYEHSARLRSYEIFDAAMNTINAAANRVPQVN